MIALLSLAEAALLATLPPQALPSQGCAAYLFTTGEERRFVAMASPGMVRVMLDGAPRDLPRIAASGSAGLGLAATTDYRGGDATATLDLTVTQRADLTEGAVIPTATLRLDRTGVDGIVVPLVGLVGCAKGG